MADLLSRFETEESDQATGSSSSSSARPRAQAVNPFDDTSEEVALQTRRIRQIAPQEFPIFKRQEVSFPVPSAITHIAASNGFVTMVMIGNIIYRFNIKNPRNVEHHEIKREGDRIHQLFQDPTGRHVLVCMESKECYYIGRSGKRSSPRTLAKVKGHLIESVAWNYGDQTDQGTGPILLGTSTGAIFETDIAFEDNVLVRRKGYFTEMHQLMYDLNDHPEPISGMYMMLFPKRPSERPKYFVLVTTPKRIYQFIGYVAAGETPYFAQLFAHYETAKGMFLEIPGNLKDSQLHIWPSQPGRLPQSFAWLTGAGVYYGGLGFGDHKPGESVFLEKTLIPYSTEEHEKTPPIGMALTQFHCLLLFRDRVEAVCVLNEKRVYEDQLNVRRDGPLYAICTDPIDGTIYTNQKLKLWVYTPHRESRNIWKIFLKQGRYEDAKKYADGNQRHMDTILIRQAEHYFQQGMYQDAAVAFSQSQLSFEEVTLKFIAVNRRDALKTFLLRKLETLTEKESTQQTMLATWLVELFLHDLGGLTDDGDRSSHRKLQEEFRGFLQQPVLRECLETNRKTVYELIASHGAVEDMVFFATLMKDFEKVITHCIQQYRYEAALEVLTEKALEALKSPEKERKSRFKRFAGLFYKFSPPLMKHCPAQTVEAWMQMDRYLSPAKLVPALIQCKHPAEPAQLSAAIKYLEFCVNKLHTPDRAIHNFLVSAYAKSKEHADYSKLLTYLVAQGKNPPVTYDTQYALRLCTEQHLDEACVHIYAAMELFEESVDLALKVDVELARQIAGTPLRNKETQRKLWLKIAQHVIKKEENIARAMQFLQECSLLKIEDILPFFPDFVTIDHFKDAICTSLTEYNAHIDDLKHEMQGATDSARNIRSDIQDIRNKCVVIQSDTKCEICESRLLSQGFYMFPCRHAFHRDCLITEVRIHLTESECSELDQLLVVASAQSAAGSEVGGGARGWDEVRTKVDLLVGAECIYCGDRMIHSIDQPFITTETAGAALDSWK